MQHFILLTDRPTDAFLGALQQADVIYRGWEQPAYLFSRRQSGKRTLKTKQGWIDPRNINKGHLHLSAADANMAHDLAVKLGDQHGVYVNNGGRIGE